MIEGFEAGAGLGHAGPIGDILPTLVTPSDARAYIRETDVQWKRLDQDVRNSAATTDEALRRAFANDYVAWLTFRDDALENVGVLNAKATMDQTDRWASKVAPWRDALRKSGATVTGPDATPPGQGLSDSTAPSMGTITWLVGGALVVAGVVAVGYLLRSIPHVPKILTTGAGNRGQEKVLA